MRTVITLIILYCLEHYATIRNDPGMSNENDDSLMYFSLAYRRCMERGFHFLQYNQGTIRSQSKPTPCIRTYQYFMLLLWRLHLLSFRCV